MYVMGTAPNLGFDYSAAWDAAKQAAKDFVKGLPGAVQNEAEKQVAAQAQPIIQAQAAAKTQRVIDKGHRAMMLVGGATLGALIAGGTWQRRVVGGTLVGAAAVAAGWQIGWLEDK